MLIPFSINTNREWEYRRAMPVAVYIIVLLCVVIHLFIKLELTTSQWIDVVYRFGVVKYDFRWYSVFTCTFLHGGWMHLIGNMLFLLVYGSTLERFLGTGRFLLLYFAGALFSILVHLLTISPFFIDVPTIGASGAISAVLGAFFVLLPTARLKCVFLFFLRPLIVTLPAYAVLGLWFAVQLYFSIEPVSMSGEVAFWAHVAGFASGALIGSLLHGQLLRITHREAQHAVDLIQSAWSAVLRGQTSAAQGYLDAYQEADLPNSTAQPLLAGLIAQKAGSISLAGDEFLRAFQKASNALNFNQMVTTYLQARRVLSVGDIPAYIHRDAGLAAASCRMPTLALDAFRQAIAAGLEEGIELILERSEAILRHKMTCVGEADTMARLKQDLDAINAT